MSRGPVAVVTALCMLISPVLYADGSPAISVNAMPCAAPNVHPGVSATIANDATSARVYFKAAGERDEYYVDMKPGPRGTMVALLPAPLATTKSFTYRVVAYDKKGKEYASAPVSTDVQVSCPNGPEAPIVLGQTVPGQSPVPDGFQCRNVVSYISSAGEMRDNVECRRILAGIPASGAGVPAGAGLNTGTIVALTAAGLIAAGVLIEKDKDKKDKDPVSPSRP